MLYLVKRTEEGLEGFAPELVTNNGNIIQYDERLKHLVITGKRKFEGLIKPFTGKLPQYYLNKIDLAIEILGLERTDSQVRRTRIGNIVVIKNLIITTGQFMQDYDYEITNTPAYHPKDNISVSNVDVLLSLAGDWKREDHIKFLTSIKEKLINYVI